MVIDTTKTALGNIIALVNAANSALSLVESAVTAKSVQTLTAANALDGRDSSVELDAMTGTAFTGLVVVRYRRLPLAPQIATQTGSASVPLGSTAAAALNIVCDYYGIKRGEVTLDTLNTAAGTHTQMLSPNATSLLYNGAAAQVSLTWS